VRAAALIALVAGCSAPDGPHRLTTIGVPGSPAPADYSANVLYAIAAVDGVGGGALLVDSGAPRLVLSPTRWTGAQVPAGSGAIDALTVGELTVEQVPVLGVDLFPARPGFAPAGLLGAEVLCQFAAVLDYRGTEVRLASAPPDDVLEVGPPARTAFALEGGGAGTLDGTPFTYPATRVPVSVTVDGAARSFVLDTGSSYLVLRDALWKQLASDGRPTLQGLPILSANGLIAGALTRARTVVVAGEEVDDPPVLDIGDQLLDSFAAEVGHPVDGLLGGAFLREFLVTIDYPSGALELRRYASRDHIDPDEFHQLGFVLDVAPPGSAHVFQVSHVFAGTDAARAGLAAGELLVAVDGVPLDRLGTDEAEQLLHGAVGTQRTVQTATATRQIAVDDLLPLP
jgi:hypothetical protein